MSGLKLHDDDPTIFPSELDNGSSACHQVYAIIQETSEELDSAGNPLVNPEDLTKGSKYVAPGTEEVTVLAREKV
jgi:hypothetical protein